MAESSIEWTDYTFNPWEGCTKVSPGCKHCYAEARNSRFGGGTAPNWGKGKPRRRTSVANWRKPLKWNRGEGAGLLICDQCGSKCFCDSSVRASSVPCFECEGTLIPQTPPRVFCASLADWLDDEVPIEWLADLLDLIRRTPNLDWQLLTKRPENFWGAAPADVDKSTRSTPDKPAAALQGRIRKVKEFCREAWDACPDCSDPLADKATLFRWVSRWLDGDAPKNVWIGTSVEDQARADERIPELLKIPAVVRFLSCEPLLEEIEILTPIYLQGENPGEVLDWVICGGESGKGARPFHIEWAQSLRDECKSNGVPFFMKQVGADPHWLGNELNVGDKKGGDMSEWPEDLRVREFVVQHLSSSRQAGLPVGGQATSDVEGGEEVSV